MPKYLHSTCFASVILDDKSIIDQKPFKDTIKANESLEETKWLEEEKALIKKHKPEFYVGFKKEKIQGMKLTQDPDKLFRIKKLLLPELNKYYLTNLSITKQKIKQSVTQDQLIIQTIQTIEALNKAINTLTKRLRETYELYNPEFSNSIEDHEKFSQLVASKTKAELLKQIKQPAKEAMGADLPKGDVKQITSLASEIVQLFKFKALQINYLENKMQEVCPNITAVAGSLIGAKLIAYAGSLKRMAIVPSSTIQLFGAEKALFRHMTKHTLPPKYGILHEHLLIAKAKRKDHGKIARTLADKISLAAKVDYFKGEFIGDKLKKELEEKFK